MRLFSRVFGMGGGAPPADAPADFGGDDANEAAAKLVRNRAAVAADIVQPASTLESVLESVPCLCPAARAATHLSRSPAACPGLPAGPEGSALAAWMLRRGAPAARGCRREAAAARRCLLKVANSAAF